MPMQLLGLVSLLYFGHARRVWLKDRSILQKGMERASGDPFLVEGRTQQHDNSWNLSSNDVPSKVEDDAGAGWRQRWISLLQGPEDAAAFIPPTQARQREVARSLHLLRSGLRAATTSMLEKQPMWEDANSMHFNHRFDSGEVNVVDAFAKQEEDLLGYLTQEANIRGRERLEVGCLLLPGKHGWKHQPTRNFADRLAVWCNCLVFVPDVKQSSMPDQVASDVRTAIAYMRGDHRIRVMGIVGVGRAADRLVELSYSPLFKAFGAAIAICPTMTPKLKRGFPPWLAIFDSKSQQADAWDGEIGVLNEELEAAPRMREITVIDAQAKDVGMVALPSPLSFSAIKKMKVAELRSHLQDMQLPTSGLKEELVQRLSAAALGSEDVEKLEKESEREDLRREAEIEGTTREKELEDMRLQRLEQRKEKESENNLVVRIDGLFGWEDDMPPDETAETYVANVPVEVPKASPLELTEGKAALKRVKSKRRWSMGDALIAEAAEFDDGSDTEGSAEQDDEETDSRSIEEASSGNIQETSSGVDEKAGGGSIEETSSGVNETIGVDELEDLKHLHSDYFSRDEDSRAGPPITALESAMMLTESWLSAHVWRETEQDFWEDEGDEKKEKEDADDEARMTKVTKSQKDSKSRMPNR